MYPWPWIALHERRVRLERELGSEHPATRAAFGREMGRMGRVLSATGSGREAWVANYRMREHYGFQNRSFRARYPGAAAPTSLSCPPGASPK